MVRIRGVSLGRLSIEKTLGLHELMSVAWSRGRMAAHFEFQRLLPKQKRQNGASSIEVVHGGGENDCGTSCSCCCPIGIAVSGEQDRKDDAFL